MRAWRRIFPNCGGSLSELVGDFASPGWPRNYTHHLNCTWTVQVPAHKVIMFTFLHFDLGKKSSSPCSAKNDRLRITEMTSHGEFRFCASPPMLNYISQTNVVSLNFITNAHSDAQGFKVIYKGVLGQVTLKFTTIDLDGQSFGSCSSQRDVINVYDGATAMDTRLARYCQHENPPPLVSSRNLMLVTFRSDAHVQRTGFHASFDFITPSPLSGDVTGSGRPGSYGEDNSGGSREGEREDSGGDGDQYSDEKPTVDNNDREHGSLTAVVVEPRWGTGHHNFRGNYTEDGNFGYNGGEFVQSQYPDSGGGTKTQSTSRRRGISTNTYISILWTLLVSLLIITLFLSLLLLMVCRNSR
ncbi:CUB domain-containing protein 2 [Elysia marginata]|uniref:CUB domain-containing protein 2 n=1 Tax=Elysia marginata TaxID=1093978 RepID=A0AAV4FWU3_9GAST|nr:CUB domain-containing protein 2 [Elysia marginata]